MYKKKRFYQVNELIEFLNTEQVPKENIIKICMEPEIILIYWE